MGGFLEEEVKPPDESIHFWYGEIAEDVSDRNDPVFVILPDFADDQQVGPCFWQSRTSTTFPLRGDKCVVILDNRQQFWVIAWWPAVEVIAQPTYQNYVPTWTSSGVASDLGNALVRARYIKIGQMVHAQGRITLGSTSIIGTGTYSIAFPIQAVAGLVVGGSLGRLEMYQAATGKFLDASAYANTIDTMTAQYGSTYLGADNGFASTTPFGGPWVAGDIWQWNVTYEGIV